jgi:hypothetical protein
VYVVKFFLGINYNLHSTYHGILVEESDDELVDLDVLDGEMVQCLAELKQIHQLESHALDVNIDKTSNEN